MIHPTALVAPGARLGRNVAVGPFSVIHENVVIGDDCTIGSHCELGHPAPSASGGADRPLVIGDRAVIRSHSVFYEGSTFGAGLATGHRVTMREGIDAGVNFQIGTLSDVQGTCRIGDNVRTHSNVHIAKHSTVGDFVWLFPFVVLTNDPHPPSDTMRGVTVEDFAVVATMSVLFPGVRVGAGALVAAHSAVRNDVKPDTVVAGTPARMICFTHQIILQDGSGPAYPWRRHFHRGYPEGAVARWIEEFGAGTRSVRPGEAR